MLCHTGSGQVHALLGACLLLAVVFSWWHADGVSCFAGRRASFLQRVGRWGYGGFYLSACDMCPVGSGRVGRSRLALRFEYTPICVSTESSSWSRKGGYYWLCLLQQVCGGARAMLRTGKQAVRLRACFRTCWQPAAPKKIQRESVTMYEGRGW
eukprot:3564700-Rhodomonas_salina.1